MVDCLSQSLPTKTNFTDIIRTTNSKCDALSRELATHESITIGSALSTCLIKLTDFRWWIDNKICLLKRFFATSSEDVVLEHDQFDQSTLTWLSIF